MDDVTQRRLEAVAELAWQEAQRRGLEGRMGQWVVTAAKSELIKGGSAWRALRVAAEYAARLAGEAA
jgi:hypothetical protein